MYGPVIEGSGFRLRPPRPEDAEVMITWFEDVEVTARLALRFPPTLESERQWLATMGQDRNHVLWAIEAEGRCVGTTAIHNIDWENRKATTGTLIGDRSFWRRGIAREMMRLRAAHAFTELPLNKLASSFMDGNEGSRRAQLAAGYKEVGRLRQSFWRQGRWHDEIITELLRDDWERENSGT